MNKFLKAFGFKEPEPRRPYIGITMRDSNCTTIAGDVEEIKALCYRLDAREESYIRTRTSYPEFPGNEPFVTEDSFWIPDVVSYRVNWGDFEPGVKNE